ncbi:MAG: ATP phosphoribosyltransferase [Solirubrobacterales bacterium]|nr:ATP phosphoribosyltransferase [Solirubrobacterales bacterium]
MFEELRKPGGKLKMAVPRGALLEEVLDLLDRVGIETTEARGDSRSLVFDGGELILITMRPSDVPTYVSAGAADVGITGKDVLLEQSDRPVYELVDLGIGPCRMVLATQKGDVAPSEHQRRLGMMKIATKYKRIAEQYFAEQGRQVELVEVKGSIELAPLVGLADGIVDLVATGRTLAENNLEVKEEILGSTGRLVANRVSYRIRREEVDDLAARFRPAVGETPGES